MEERENKNLVAKLIKFDFTMPNIHFPQIVIFDKVTKIFPSMCRVKKEDMKHQYNHHSGLLLLLIT